jgi:hypothetical protein
MSARHRRSVSWQLRGRPPPRQLRRSRRHAGGPAPLLPRQMRACRPACCCVALEPRRPAHILRDRLLAGSPSRTSPSCPKWLLPHMNMWPFVVSAALCASPAASCTTGSAHSASTTVGAWRSRRSPRPSWPALLWPHAYTWHKRAAGFHGPAHRQPVRIITACCRPPAACSTLPPSAAGCPCHRAAASRHPLLLQAATRCCSARCALPESRLPSCAKTAAAHLRLRGHTYGVEPATHDLRDHDVMQNLDRHRPGAHVGVLRKGEREGGGEGRQRARVGVGGARGSRWRA